MNEVDDASHVSPHTEPQTSAQHGIPPWEKAAPRWIAGLGALGFGILYMALPENLTFGPSWAPLAIEVVLLLPIFLSRLLRHPISHHTTRMLMFILLGIITLALIIGVVLLIVTLPHRAEAQATGLLRTGVLLWLSNILVFALWYWEIDGGGPGKRHLNGYKGADFLFPQQVDGNTQGWVPNFIDYLFVSFTGATALSPADTYPLSRPAKGLMMVEAVIALVVLAILIGRAVNIL
jgi:uncharacterized membrane protein